MVEEFGDILLSGLLWIIRERTGKDSFVTAPEYWEEAARPPFWTQILEQRAELLSDITSRLSGLAFEGPSPLSSLAGAKERLSELRPADFASFIEGWLVSLSEWRDRVSALPRIALADKGQAISRALAELGLS